jgi:hypothetical protein
MRQQEPRKRIPDFTAEQAAQACRELIVECAEDNSTKFVVVFDDQMLAPKKVISRAVEIATGEPFSVRLFSGGEESNRRLRKAGLTVWLKTDYALELAKQGKQF